MEESHLVLLDDGELYPAWKHVVQFESPFHGKEIISSMGTALRAEAQSQRRVLIPLQVPLVEDSPPQ